MRKFILVFLAGVLITFASLFIIGSCSNRSNQVQYFDKPISYEYKAETSFQVFQVLGDAALANEESSTFYNGYKMYLGKTVLLLGENFYDNQIIEIDNPKQIGTYKYTNTRNELITVPVIKQ